MLDMFRIIFRILFRVFHNDLKFVGGNFVLLTVVGRCCRGALLETGSQDPVATRVPTLQ